MFVIAVGVLFLLVLIVGTLLARPDLIIKPYEFVNQSSEYKGTLVLIGRRMEARIATMLDPSETLIRASRHHTKTFIPMLLTAAVLWAVALGAIFHPTINFGVPGDPSDAAKSVEKDLKRLNKDGLNAKNERQAKKQHRRKQTAKKDKQQAKPPPAPKTETRVSFSSWWIAGPILVLLSLLLLLQLPTVYRWLTKLVLVTDQGVKRLNLMHSWWPGKVKGNDLGAERIAGAAVEQGWWERRMRCGTIIVNSTVVENPDRKD